ncbi:MAG: dienelactone hydrolase family protein [Stellaceae bacterium]
MEGNRAPSADLEADETTWAENCQAMVEHSRTEGAQISLTVYPGAYHAFNVARFDLVFA